MYQVKLTNPVEFLSKYWQKEPVILRAAFDNFIDPIDEHELAGLAQEDVVDSRIIANEKGKWSVEQGPIEDFAQHCIGAWSLLVQGVDQYSAQANDLLNAFNFIPKWRIEDLMVSYSEAEAGVGPHIDQYDVFIVQGKGSRRWQVGSKQDHQNHYKTVIPHPKLSQIQMFTPIIDEVLFPGDMIYIPPNFPHNGVALEPCLNYSVGFRAPNQKDLITALADYAQYDNRLTERFTDPDRTMAQNNYLIQSADTSKFRALITNFAESNEFEQFLGYFLTTIDTFEEENSDETNHKLTGTELDTFLEQGGCLVKSLNAKCLLIESHQPNWTLFVNQIPLSIQKRQVKYVSKILEMAIIDEQCLTQVINEHHVSRTELITLLLEFVACNAWYTE